MKTKMIFSMLIMQLFLLKIEANESVQNNAFQKIATTESTKNWMHLKKPMKPMDFLKSLKTVFELDEGASFKNRKTETDDLGWTHYKVQ